MAITYKPQLDGLRSVCIAFTMFNHVKGVPTWINGSVGVDIFFALSGFLITTLLLDEHKCCGKISIRGFYIRRLFRIVPLYALAFATTAVAAYVLMRNGQPVKFQELSAAWPWISTFNRELCPESCGSFFGHSWTIGIEEKFYIFWPLAFVFLVNSRWFISILFAISILMLFAFPAPLIRGYVGIIFGCVGAFLHFRAPHNRPTLIGATSATLLLFGSYLVTLFLDWPAENLLISISAVFLIRAILTDEKSIVTRALAAKVPAFLGKLTYGIYLFHVLVINAIERLPPVKAAGDSFAWLATVLLAYPIVAGVAYALYKTTEKPLINIGRRWAATS